MPRISIIVPTIRVGGLDVLLSSLEQQVFKDFELILVDGIYKYRHHLIKDRLNDFSFRIKHIEPIDNPFPINSFQRCCNSGLIQAEGEIVYFTCDYSWLPYDCLLKHHNFHQAHSDSALVGVFCIFKLPEVHQSFPVYGWGDTTEVFKGSINWQDEAWRMEICNKWCEDYCRDLQAGKLDEFMWSIFAREFDAQPQEFIVSNVFHVEQKATYPNGLCHFACCHLKNDSVSLQSALLINGFDEEFDGSHAYQDTEFAERLMMNGTKWHLDRNNIIFLADSHSYMIIRKTSRPESSNANLYHTKHANRHSDPIKSILIK